MKLNITYGKWKDTLGNIWGFSVFTETLNDFVNLVEHSGGKVYKNMIFKSFDVD